MSIMLTELYDALIAAGAPDAQARSAASAVAAYENRLARIDTDLAVLKWMVGAVLAVVLVLLAKAFA